MSHPDFLRTLMKADLNLLTVLHALLEHGSTQAAADEIGRTQSAVSHALARLRSLFNDPLLMRKGPRLVPTELALQLQQPLQSVLYDVSNLIQGGPQFDPATSERRIILAARDLALAPAMTVYRRLKIEAPHARFRLVDAEHAPERLLNGQVDLYVTLYINSLPHGLELTTLGSVAWTCFVRADHPISDRPTVEEWASYDHVQVHMGPNTKGPVEDAATVSGAKRRVSLQVDSFVKALFVVSQTDLLFTSLGALGRPLAAPYGLREIALPLDIAPLAIGIGTRATTHDPLSKWLARAAQEALADQSW